MINIEDYPKYIDIIEEKIMMGEFNSQIAKELHISRNVLPKIIRSLNDPSSSIYNVERYNKILQKQDELLRKSHLDNDYFINGQSLGILKKLLAGEIDLRMAAKERRTFVVQFLLELSNNKVASYYEAIQKFLKPYGFAKEDNQKEVKKPFSEYPNNFKKEMLLLALTYRVSFKSMAKLLNTTVLDIAKGFMSVMDFNVSDMLFLDTIGNDLNTELNAYENAKNYLLRRNALVRYLNTSINHNDQEKKEFIKEKIRNLQHEIDDSKIEKILNKGKKSYTIEEKDTIARYTVKYYLSLMSASNILHMEAKKIKEYIFDLAERDAIFSGSLDFYCKIYKEMQRKIKLEIEENDVKRSI